MIDPAEAKYIQSILRHLPLNRELTAGDVSTIVKSETKAHISPQAIGAIMKKAVKMGRATKDIIHSDRRKIPVYRRIV